MPRHPRAEVASQSLHVRISREERQRLEEAARVNRQTLSDFLRDAGADRADETLDPDERATK